MGRFLAYEFASSNWRTQLRKLVNGVKVYSITQTILNSVPVWLPPLPEQEAIVERLDRETGRIDRAIEVKRRQIALLRERREIIIDEVVTGKVRVVQPPVLQGGASAPPMGAADAAPCKTAGAAPCKTAGAAPCKSGGA